MKTFAEVNVDEITGLLTEAEADLLKKRIKESRAKSTARMESIRQRLKALK